MKNTFRTGLYTRLADGRHTVLLYLDQEPNVDKLIALVESDEVKQVSIEVEKKKRTLTANNYMFALLGQISKKVGLPLGDCYVKHIIDFGVSVGSFMTKEAFDVFEPSYNKVATSLDHDISMCVITKEFTKCSVDWVEFEAFIGSSEYNSKQFSHLLDGVVNEAKELGIETLEDMKIKQLMEEYDEHKKT